MRKSNPLVSVIIPVHNGEDYLGEAIESALAQTYGPIEIIVVDDGSTDGSADVARSHKEVQYIYQPNRGAAAARNTALEASRGEFVAFLDADDLWLPDKLKVQVGHLFANPRFGFNICLIENFLDPGIEVPSAIEEVPMMRERMSLIGMVVRRSVFDRTGVFDTSYKVGSDFEWVSRAKGLGIEMEILPIVLFRRRVHGRNLSSDMEARQANFLRMFRASVERRGKKGSG